MSTHRKSSNSTAPRDVHAEITARIIEQLDKGIVPWRKPWRDVQGFGPTSLSTGREYSGVNVLLLSIEALSKGYSSRFWGTYNQIQERGGQVRKGEKGTQIVLSRRVPEKKNAAGEVVKDGFWFLRFFTVFNADQADNLVVPETVEPEGFDPIERIQEILDGMPQRPQVNHSAQNRAFYSPVLDTVTLPLQSQFKTAEGYYSTFAHELVHATGHESRLNRTFGKSHGDVTYAAEELIAEIGACLLLAEAGVEPEFEQSASYIASWREKLSADPKVIVKAASGASKAADFIVGRDRNAGWEEAGQASPAEAELVAA